MGNPVPTAARPAADPFESVDADLALLGDLGPAEQVPVFGRIHAGLTGALAATAGPTQPSTSTGSARPPAGGR